MPLVYREMLGCPATALSRLEQYAGKLASTVLRGLGSGNGAWLLDKVPEAERDDITNATQFIAVMTAAVKKPRSLGSEPAHVVLFPEG